MPKDDISLERLAQHFGTFNKSEGKLPRTVEWYSRVIRYFTAYLKAQGMSTQLGDVDIHAVREFILYLQNRTRWADHLCKPCPEGILWPLSAFRTMSGASGRLSPGCTGRATLTPTFYRISSRPGCRRSWRRF